MPFCQEARNRGMLYLEVRKCKTSWEINTLYYVMQQIHWLMHKDILNRF